MADIVLQALEDHSTFAEADLLAIRNFKRLYSVTYGTHEHEAHRRPTPA